MSGSFGSSDDDNSLEFDSTDDGLDKALAKSGIEAPVVEQTPVYKVMADSKIAVSSVRGKLWKSRKKACQTAMKDIASAWDEAIRYYNHDQSEHRDNTDPSHAGNRYVARRLNDKFSATENIVYSNVNAQLPELYAKNPDITISSGASSDDESWKESSGLARAIEKLINVLFSMKVAPGIGLKSKAKRATVIALLTNRVWFEIGYTNKDESSDQALQDLQTLSTAITEADDQEDIKEAEGALRALEEKVSFLQASGPHLHLRMPHQVLVDPDANDPWLMDAQWVMIEDMMPTEYLVAMYGEQKDPSNPDDETIVSIYDPTHILDGGSVDDEQESFSLFDDKKDYNAYGFDNKDSFNKAKRTKVWRVWDRTTRRLELYSDKDWSWPIWVWDDPYQLDSFFPLTPLWFHENPISMYAKGEVSYYLDQQDQINEINDEKRRALMWARRNIFYDKNKVQKDEVEKILKGPEPTATGLDVPEGMKGADMIFSIAPPSINFTQLFDKKDLYAAIDRIAATNDMMRGEQFKTNTTNKAIDYYSTMGNMRMDERLDAIEDTFSDVGWKLAQLCLRFMSTDTVQQLIGEDVSKLNWRPLDTLHDYNTMSMTVVGGSTQKLSTSGKKQEATQVGQILSQFSRAAPASVLKVTLRLFAEAFDDLEIREEDWDAITQEAQQVLAQGAPQQPGAGGPPGAPPGMAQGAGGPPGATPGGGPGVPPGGAVPGNPIDMVAGLLGQLPPQMLKALGLMLARGVPPQAIAQQIQQTMTQHGAA